MPKRKLSDLTNAPPTNNSRDDRFLTGRLTQKFEFGVVSLSRALKTARGFERQKLGRREKTAKSQENNSETLKRLEEEIQVLKFMDTTIVAQKYLFKQLSKTKRIAETPPFIRFKQSKKISLEGPRSTAEANVAARLYKSNPVQNVFPGIMDGIRSLLGVEAVTAEKKQEKKKKEKKDSAELKKKSTDAQGLTEKKSGRSIPAQDDSEAVSDGDTGDQEAVLDVDMEDVESGDEEDFSHFDARIASDSEDGGSASDDDDASDDGSITHADLRQRANRSEMSISLSPEPDSPPSKKQKAKSSGQKGSTAPTTGTMFLPSLTMGGYWSGSEEEEDVDRAEEPPKRKNRMGQQARRALWEKKFGTGANHIKQQNAKGRNNRDSGWDVRRGATGRDDGGRGNRGYGRNGMGGQSRQGGDSSNPNFVSVEKKPQDDKPLHPSWEAARKAKEQKNTASFQGKKMVFD